MVWIIIIAAALLLASVAASLWLVHQVQRAPDASPKWVCLARELEMMSRYMAARLDNLQDALHRLSTQLDRAQFTALVQSIETVRRDYSLLVERFSPATADMLSYAGPAAADTFGLQVDDLVGRSTADLGCLVQQLHKLDPVTSDPSLVAILRSAEELVKGNQLIQRRVASFKSALPDPDAPQIVQLAPTPLESPRLAAPATQSAQLALKRLAERELDVPATLEFVYENLAAQVPFHRMGFAVLIRDRVVARWQRSDRPLRLVEGYSAQLEGSSLSFVANLQRPRILNDLVAYLELRPQSHSTRLVVEEGFRSSLTCPVIHRGHTIGFLFFSSDRPDCFSDRDAAIAMEIAALVAAAFARERERLLYEIDAP